MFVCHDSDAALHVLQDVRKHAIACHAAVFLCSNKCALDVLTTFRTDVGGYGCGESRLPTDPYMQQLIVRWYQFGAFSPVFRTHGCRSGPSEPNTKQCTPAQGSCGFYEIWSYGSATQVMLEKMVRLRSEVIKPYIKELSFEIVLGSACPGDWRKELPKLGFGAQAQPKSAA